MHIHIINPNTTRAMTDTIGACARAVAGPGTHVEAVQPSMGPASIESHYDEALAVPGLLEQIADGEQQGVDGYVIACFGDPGLDAARELARGPVVGIAEAAMHMATLIGRTFAIVTTLSRTVGQARDLAVRYGFDRRCVSITACDVPVLELDDPASNARALVIEECRRVVAATGADVIVLGCAGMADFCATVEQAIGLPVVDGVAAGTKLIESLVSLGLRTSTRDEYASPIPKPIEGLLEPFALVE